MDKIARVALRSTMLRVRQRGARCEGLGSLCIRMLSSGGTPRPTQTRLRSGWWLALLSKKSTEPLGAQNVRVSIQRMMEAARPELGLLAGAMLALLVSSGTTLVFPMAIGTIVDHMNLWEETPREEQSATLRQQRDKLTSQAVALAGVFLVGSVASFGRVALLKIAGAVPPECRSDIHRRGYLQYQGHQCRKGYHVAWATMSHGIPCRMGYHFAVGSLR